MDDLKKTVGANLQELRKERKLTQLELAEMFGYSDKAVSKWENGDTLPDLETLYKLATFYGVTIDFLIKEKDDEERENLRLPLTNKITITCLLVSIVWMIATIIYVWLLMRDAVNHNFWEVFIWACPISCLVLFYANHLWGKRTYIFYIGTVFIWTLIAATYVTFRVHNPWPIWLLGIPAQIILLLWVGIKPYNTKSPKKK